QVPGIHRLHFQPADAVPGPVSQGSGDRPEHGAAPRGERTSDLGSGVQERESKHAQTVMRAVSTQASTQQFGRYELLSELGQGAMGVVYKARDPVLDREVAIKTINLTLPKDELSEYEARFYQEARAAGGLNHPNIVTIYDIGKTERVAYMAMEFLEGQELRSVLASREPLPVELALDIAAQVADGLAYAHDCHIVHRDI